MLNITVSVSRSSFVMRAGDYWYSAVAATNSITGDSVAVARDSDGCVYVSEYPHMVGSAMRHMWHIALRECRWRAREAT